MIAASRRDGQGRLKMVLAGLAAMVLLAVGVGAFVMHGLKKPAMMPPGALTRFRIDGIESKLRLHYRTAGSFPGEISEIGPEQHEEMIDGWGRQLVYRRLSPTECEIRSLGKDGMPGGTADAADVVLRVRATH